MPAKRMINQWPQDEESDTSWTAGEPSWFEIEPFGRGECRLPPVRLSYTPGGCCKTLDEQDASKVGVGGGKPQN